MAFKNSRPRVFLDVNIGEEPAGRLTIELFTDHTPQTCENFRQLCTGEYNCLSYAKAPFHRIIDEFIIQGGDIAKGDGTGITSIYGQEFNDENLNWRGIDAAGLVCAANRGKDTNGSQFFITLEPCDHLNGKHTIFGHLVSGEDTLQRIAKVETDKNDCPLEPVLISRCGELEKRNKTAIAPSIQMEAPAQSRDRGRKQRKLDSDVEMENKAPPLGSYAAPGTQIFDHTERCFGIFKQFLEIGDERYHDFARQLQDRLATWNRYSGASAKLGYRLDDRLGGFDTITEAFVALLTVIVDNMAYACTTFAAKREGTDRNLSGITSSLPKESGIIFEQTSIKDTFEKTGGKPWGEIILAISELLSLTRTVRESSISNREAPVPVHYQRKDSDFFEQTCRILTRARFPDARSTLTDQLSKSITIRRNRLLYRRDHEEKLQRGDDEQDTILEPEPIAAKSLQEQSSRAPRPLGPIPEHGEASGMHAASKLQQPPTLLSKPRQSIALRPRRELKTTGSVFGRSNRMEADLKAMYPDKPKASLGDRSHGICPYCFVPQPLPISDNNWRAHIDKDLQVYICLSEHCADNIKFFDRSDAWLNHMRQEHNTQQAQSTKQVHDATWIQNIHLGLWFCNLEHEDCTDELIFSNVMEFELHLREIHKLETRTVDMYRRRKRRRGDFREPGLCPLCEKKPDSGSQLVEHIASHLRSLAMLSLPGFAKDVDEEDDPVSIDPMSQPSRKRSSHAAADQTQDADLSDETPSEDLLADERGLLSSIVSFDDSNEELLRGLLHEKMERFSEESDEILLHFQRATSTAAAYDSISAESQSTLAELEKIKYEAWLMPPEFRLEQDKFYQLHEPETGSWFFDSPEYDDWISDSSIKPLWVSGKPGCGKTVLCSMVVEDLQKHCSRTVKSGFAYFYFSFSDTKKQSCEDLLRSLVAQLACKPELSSIVLQAYMESNGVLASVLELERLLLRLLRSFDEAFLILDALDECPRKNQKRQEVLKLLYRLSLETPHVKILVTSRKRSDISTSLQAVHLEMSRSVVESDIRRYVAAELSRDSELSTLGQEEKLELTDHIVANADGMFRWAECKLNQLKRLETSWGAQGFFDQYLLLHSIPPLLRSTYERILDEIAYDSPYLPPELMPLLKWLAYSFGPLRVNEAATAMILDLAGPRNLDTDEVLNMLRDLVVIEDVETDDNSTDPLLESDDPAQDDTRPSATTWPDSNRVKLVHESARQYLESPELLQTSVLFIHLDARRDNGYLAEWCVKYLIHYAGTGKWTTARREDWSSYPLLEYAAQYWYQHASRSSSHDCPSLVGTIIGLLTDVEATTCWLMIHWPDNEEANPLEDNVGSEVYWASYLGLTDVVRELIDARVDVDGGEGYYGTALNAASCQGHHEIVKILLDAGANVNMDAGPFDSALHVASTRGYEGIVATLLERGADVNAKRLHDIDPLEAAIVGRYPNIVALLIDAGAILDMNGPEMSPLQFASKFGDEQTVETIIRKGRLDATTHYEGFGRALLTATESDQRGAVRILIAAGTDINYHEGDGDPPALYAASELGRLHIVQALLDAGADVNSNVGQYGNALNAALEKGHLEIARALIDAGADSNASMHCLPFGLCAAVQLSGEEMVKMFIRFGADVNIPDSRTEGLLAYPLELAAESGNAKIVRMLLLAGANVDDATEQPALMRASRLGSEEIVEILLQSGADVNFMRHDATTALKTAAEHGHDSVVAMLLEAGVRIDSTLNDTALMGAAMGGHEKVVEVLLRGGARTTEPGSQNALWAAASRGHETIVKILLDAGADVNGTWNHVPLTAAAEGGHKQVARMLLEHGAYVNRSKDDGVTALYTAARYGHGDLAAMLINAGADVSHTTANGYTALQAAVSQGHSEVVRMLIDHGADPNHAQSDGFTALHMAAVQGNSEVVQMLIDYGSDPNRAPSDGFTALHMAAAKGNLDVAILLAKGNVDVYHAIVDGVTALQVAAARGHEEVVGMLLETGQYSVSTISSALCAAAGQGHVAVVEKLLHITAPAELETLIEDGGEALQRAARSGHEEIVKMLIESGVEVDARGPNGETALQLATESGHERVVQMLLRHGAHRDMMRHWFIPGDGIDQVVIENDIQRYFGPYATARPGVGTDEYAGVQGYWIKAYRNLTPAMIAELRADSQKQEEIRAAALTGSYIDSVTNHQSTAARPELRRRDTG